ncbi:hypothetical protein EV421DRAFT_1897561 [Armillaria borealis]|uniref:RNase III domain-containing protein n=1 Tax=Armillaria borealis TaxID=47425 RepID=A0AA39K518_9AGAR|nr:hypothetical protein EV421DRAFT_1897561 [Armillaria borealis]
MYSNSSRQSASNSTLKRTRSSEHVQLPQLEPDMYLRVYTHKSLRRACASPDKYEDNERLSLVGEKAFDAAVTTALFYERPLLEMEAKKRDITSWTNIDSWVRRYQMREKVRCHPELFEALHSPGETKALFYAYVGAVFVNLGMDVVQEWINALTGLGGTQRPFPSHRKVKNLPTCRSQPRPIQPTPPRPSPQSSPYAQFSRFLVPMPNLPPPLSPKLPNPTTPAQPHRNEKASQQGVVVEYAAQASNPPHTGTWSDNCAMQSESSNFRLGIIALLLGFLIALYCFYYCM